LRRGVVLFVALSLTPLLDKAGSAQDGKVSEATEHCIECHAVVTPAIVGDWKNSRHARVTPGEALSRAKLQRRVSADQIKEDLSQTVVGCAECHSLNPEAHKDAFDHSDQKVHITVTPRDCAVCHPVETDQYQKNLMSHARVNLVKNPVYGSLARAVNGLQSLKGMRLSSADSDEKTDADSCYHCHGTAVEVKGNRTKETNWGEMEFPILSGWPNQGVGRFNPDGSMGSCTACHSRHQFSIQVARKPYTCSQCHKGPDVPAFKAFEVSKHANLVKSLEGQWDFKEVPWTLGKDVFAPTCAVCHVSLFVSPEGEVIAERTHQMADRLPWRIFGVIYAHPHPKSPDTSVIKNKEGLPLPTSLNGELAAEFLISPEEQQQRRERLQKVCLNCHSSQWVSGHWERFENTIRTTDAMTLTATELVTKAWQENVADKTNMFDEAIEKQWVEQWFFYANSTRFASAMMGADYGVFENGRWYMAKNTQEMLDRLKFLLSIKTREK